MLACFCDESQICYKKGQNKSCRPWWVTHCKCWCSNTISWLDHCVSERHHQAFGTLCLPLAKPSLGFLIFFAKEFTKIFFFKPKGKIIAEMKSSNAVTVSAAIKGFSPLSNLRLPFKILVSPTLLRLSLCLLLRPFNKQTPRTWSIVGAPCGAN